MLRCVLHYSLFMIRTRYPILMMSRFDGGKVRDACQYRSQPMNILTISTNWQFVNNILRRAESGCTYSYHIPFISLLILRFLPNSFEILRFLPNSFEILRFLPNSHAKYYAKTYTLKKTERIENPKSAPPPMMGYVWRCPERCTQVVQQSNPLWRLPVNSDVNHHDVCGLSQFRLSMFCKFFNDYLLQ